MANKDKYIQDTGEKYFVFKLAEEAKNYLRHPESLQEHNKNFVEYANNLDILEDFMRSDYKKTYDAGIPEYFKSLLSKFGTDVKFVISDIEKEYRALGKKGDFAIDVFRGDTKIASFSTSLKCYNDGASIQFSSGTYSSLACSLLFDQAKTGVYINPITNKTFRSGGKYIRKRNEAIMSNYGANALTYVQQFDEAQKKVTEFINTPVCESYFNITYNGVSNKYTTPDNIRKDEFSGGWKEFCKYIAYDGLQTFLLLIKEIPSTTIVNKFKKTIGINEEELLIFTTDGKMVNSLTDTKLQYLRKVFTTGNKDDFDIIAEQHGQSINFGLTYKGDTLITINVPLTINKNGAWELDNIDGRYTKTDKQFVNYGQRRPVKSKQMATSTNCYIKLTDICDTVQDIF